MKKFALVLNDISSAEIFNNDLTEFLRINDIIEQVRAVHPGLEIRDYDIRRGRTEKVLRRFKAIIIQPDSGVLGNTLVTNSELNAKRMAHGEKKSCGSFGHFVPKWGQDGFGKGMRK